MKLKQYLLASAVCVVPFSASAADLPVKAPYRPVAVAVPFTWTGFYVGGSAGFISQNSVTTELDPFLPGSASGDTFGVPGHGGLFGINAGYNYQMGAWVIGIEADIAASTLNNSTTNYNYFWGYNQSFTSKLSSLGTVRGRIGYAFDRALLYATGGFAYGHVENAFSMQSHPGFGGSTSGTQTGWTVGGGFEYAVTNNWTVRAEGLYVDLGTTTATAASTCRFAFKNTYTVGRLGLNYKF
jgi:outer membrane immunogenic protein